MEELEEISQTMTNLVVIMDRMIDRMDRMEEKMNRMIAEIRSISSEITTVVVAEEKDYDTVEFVDGKITKYKRNK